MADTCPPCDHALRDHKAQPNPFGDVMTFECNACVGVEWRAPCRCAIDGTVNLVAERRK